MPNPLIERLEKSINDREENAIEQIGFIRDFIESDLGFDYLLKKFLNYGVRQSRGFIRYASLEKRTLNGEVTIELGELFSNRDNCLGILIKSNGGEKREVLMVDVRKDQESEAVPLSNVEIVKLLGAPKLAEFYKVMMEEIGGERDKDSK